MLCRSVAAKHDASMTRDSHASEGCNGLVGLRAGHPGALGAAPRRTGPQSRCTALDLCRSAAGGLEAGVAVVPVMAVADIRKGRVYDSNTVGRIGEPDPSSGSGSGSASVGVARRSGWVSGVLGPAARALLGASGPAGGVVARGGGASASSAGSAGRTAAGPAGASGPGAYAGPGGPGTTLSSALVARAGTGSGDHSHECLLGAACYATAFKLSALGCVAALVLAVIAGVRRERRSHRSKRLPHQS